MRGLACHSRRGRVDLAGGDGIESAARDARYRAFNELAAQAGVQHILLAQHRNDQAETVLLRLLRGAGPTGLAAIDRKSVVEGKSVSVRVDLGGRRILKKKTEHKRASSELR